MRETTGKWGKIEEMVLSCPSGSERLAMTLAHTKISAYLMHGSQLTEMKKVDSLHVPAIKFIG